MGNTESSQTHSGRSDNQSRRRRRGLPVLVFGGSGRSGANLPPTPPSVDDDEDTTDGTEAHSFSRRLRARRSHSMPASHLPNAWLVAPQKHRRASPSTSQRKKLTTRAKRVYTGVTRRLLGRAASALLSKSAGSGLLGAKESFFERRMTGVVRNRAAREHAKQMRELVTGWSGPALHCLLAEYEAAHALRELTLRADASRPASNSLRDDLGRLLHDAACCDMVLGFDHCRFDVHRAILRERSAFFKNFLAATGPIGQRIDVVLPTKFYQMTADTFGLVLHYLYTGEIAAKLRNEIELMLKLKDQFGTPHTLEFDVYSMLQQAHTSGDAVLVFVSNSDGGSGQQPCSSSYGVELDAIVPYQEPSSPNDDEGSYGAGGTPSGYNMTPNTGRVEAEIAAGVVDEESPSTRNWKGNISSGRRRYSEFRCHASVLAARSAFFRNLIQKRLLSEQENDEEATVLRIVLDESVIPRIYAPVLLHALYTDQVDLSQVIRDCPVSANSLSEVQAIASGKCQMSPIDEATEIYQIARFLEFDTLAQGCEDIIVRHVDLDCLPSVYNWSAESHGSSVVRRHTVNYLCREFARVVNTPLLYDLEETLLVAALKSDFVQASELEILQAVIRWGEQALIRRMEEREPNILNGTTHSITRKGVRRSELSDDELKEILENLLPLVRSDFILPPQHQSLVQAISRGLISCPPTDQPSGRTNTSDSSDGSPEQAIARPAGVTDDVASVDQHWLNPHSRRQTAATFLRSGSRYGCRPRLFYPYMEEVRNQLQKRIQDRPELALQLHEHNPPSAVHPHQRHLAADVDDFLPDTLYMVRRKRSEESLATSNPAERQGTSESNSGNNCELELVLPDYELVEAVENRVAEILSASTTVQKGFACGCAYHRRTVLKQVRLRVLREFGLADQFLRVLRHPSRFYSLPRRPLSAVDVAHYDNSALHDAAVACSSSEPAARRFASEPYLGDVAIAHWRDSGSRLTLGGASSNGEAWPDLMSDTLPRDYGSVADIEPLPSHCGSWPIRANNSTAGCSHSKEQYDAATSGSSEEGLLDVVGAAATEADGGDQLRYLTLQIQRLTTGATEQNRRPPDLLGMRPQKDSKD